MVISGLLYMFYRYPGQAGITGLNINSVKTIAIFHTVGAFLLICFIIAHLYLITTGATVTSNLKAMITGFEELDEKEHHTEEINNENIEKEIINE
jgi:thiosulfate reductase cytochrome b subunit